MPIRMNWDTHSAHNPGSSTVMDKVHPSLKGDIPLPTQLLHRKPECLRRSFMVQRRPSRIREERLIKILCQVPTVFVHHRPHRAHNAAESAVLYRSS